MNRYFRILIHLQLFLLTYQNSWAAASQKEPQETHISAAVLVPLTDSVTNTFNKMIDIWDLYHKNLKDYGKFFDRKRTLLGRNQASAYHITLVNFEFPTENLSEQRKQQLKESLNKQLQVALARIPSDIPPLRGVGRYEIFQGESRTGKLGAKYLVAAFETNENLTSARDEIISHMLREFPDAYVREDFVPHVSLVQMAPELDVTLPSGNISSQGMGEKYYDFRQLLTDLYDKISVSIVPEKLQVSVKELPGRSNQNFGSRLRQLSSDLYYIGARVI